jgi:signal transduction histidine kinase
MDSGRAGEPVVTTEYSNPWHLSPAKESLRWRRLFASPLIKAGVAVLVIAAVGVAIRDPLDFDDRPHIERMLKLAVDSVQSDIVADMDARLLAQVRLAQLWKVNEMSPREWDAAARLFLAHQLGYEGLQLLDRTLHRQRAAVLTENADLDPVLDVPADGRLWNLLKTATTSTDSQVMTAAFTLHNEKLAYLIIVPSFAEEEIVGYLAVVCDVKKTFDSILSDHVRSGYSIAVLRDSAQIYQNDGSDSANRKGWSQTTRVPLTAVDWRVEVWPTPEMLADARSQLPELGALLVSLLILFLVSTIHFARKLQVSSVHLQTAHDELERHIQERTAELRQTNDDLQDEIAERSQIEEMLRKLSADLLHSQDQERRRIARELHDSTVQTLSALKIKISGLRKLAALDGCHSGTLLQQSGQLAEQALSEIRSLSYLLHPPILEDFGLESALTWYAAGFGERSGIRVDVEIDPELGRFSQEVELIMFRIVQEALGNIHRHSGSSTARISLSGTSTDVTLMVSDKGRGLPKNVLDPKSGSMPHVGVGIAGMRERVRQFGGKLEITSTYDGTTVRVVLPVGERQPNANAAA